MIEFIFFWIFFGNQTLVSQELNTRKVQAVQLLLAI